MPADPSELSAGEAARRLHEGALDAEELTRACLDRIEALEPTVQAWTHIDPDYALEQARAADERRVSGAPIGPLHGLPVTIKVNVDQKGCATTNGVTAFKDVIAPADAPLVRLFREAGAIPATVETTFAGATAEMNEAFDSLTFSMLFAVLVVYVVMVLALGSLITPFIILFSLPLAAIGAFPALALTGATGFDRAGKRRGGVIGAKARRMPWIVANGLLILVPSAIFLAMRAGDGRLDLVFYAVQAVELTFGAINLTLLGLSLRDGLRLTGRLRRMA